MKYSVRLLGPVLLISGCASNQTVLQQTQVDKQQLLAAEESYCGDLRSGLPSVVTPNTPAVIIPIEGASIQVKKFGTVNESESYFVSTPWIPTIAPEDRRNLISVSRYHDNGRCGYIPFSDIARISIPSSGLANITLKNGKSYQLDRSTHPFCRTDTQVEPRPGVVGNVRAVRPACELIDRKQVTYQKRPMNFQVQGQRQGELIGRSIYWGEISEIRFE